MGDNSKNGYEIRESLLGMAIDILKHQNARQVENEYFKPEGTRQPVNPYATEDVLIVAEKLYDFVQKK